MVAPPPPPMTTIALFLSIILKTLSKIHQKRAKKRWHSKKYEKNNVNV